MVSITSRDVKTTRPKYKDPDELILAGVINPNHTPATVNAESSCKRIHVTMHVENKELYLGDEINGFLRIRVKTPLVFDSSRLKLCGKERVAAYADMVEDATEADLQNKTAHAVRTYYREIITLAGPMITTAEVARSIAQRGGSDAPSALVLPAGNHVYPFRFVLPKDQPPSYETGIRTREKIFSHSYSSMEYYLRFYLDVPKLPVFLTTVLTLNVRPDGFNNKLYIPKPISAKMRYYETTCCCYRTGEILTRLTLNKNILVAGTDGISLSIDIDNTKSKQLVNGVSVKLIHLVRFLSNGVEVNTRKDILWEDFDAKVTSRSSSKSDVVTHPIAANLMPTMTTSGVVSRYEVVVLLLVKGVFDPTFVFNEVMVLPPVRPPLIKVDTPVEVPPTPVEEPAYKPKPSRFEKFADIYKKPVREPTPEPQYTAPPRYTLLDFQCLPLGQLSIPERMYKEPENPLVPALPIGAGSS